MLIRVGIYILAIFVSFEAQAKKVDAKDALLMQSLMQNSEMSALKTELLVEKSEKKAIKQLHKLIRKYKGTPLEADMQMRLAELYVRRSKTVLFFEMNRDEKNVIDFMPKRLKKKSSRNFVSRAIKIYNYIERKFPNYENIDLVIFNNGMAYQQVGQPKTAEKKYWQLVRDHNYSPLVPDAHLAIGEINYALKRFKRALDHFQAIKKYPESRVYPYGLYKGAWSYYNLKDTRNAMLELEEVVKFGVYVSKNNIDARLDLRKEAISDMALFYSETRSSKNAYAYFKAQAGELEADPYLFKLAGLYGSYSKYNDKKIVLQDFIDNEQASLRLPEAFQLIVNNYESMKNRPKAVKQLQTFNEFCYDSSWVKSQPKKAQKPVEDCRSRLDKTTRILAKKWLRMWKKNPKYPVFAKSAVGAFAIYLEHNTKKAEARKMRYVYADLLFQLKDFKMASEQYEMVGSFFYNPKAKKQKFNKMAHDARYASIVSLEKSVNDKWTSSTEERLRKLVKDYSRSHPDGKYRLDVEFKVAMISYESKNYEEALVLFKGLGDKYGHKAKGIKSQDFYLDILNIKKDYKNLKEYTAKLLKKKPGPKRVAKIRKIYQQSYFLIVQAMEEKGEFKKAAVEYKKFAKENKRSPLAEKAWWNAIQLHYKSNEFLVGAQAAEAYYKLFPKAVHVKDAMVKAAQSYEAIGDTVKAASSLNILSKIDPKESTKWLVLSADFDLISGHELKAKKKYYRILNTPFVKHHAHAMRSIEVIESKKPLSKGHMQIINIITKKDLQPDASLLQLKLLEAVYQTKDYAKSFIEAKKVLNMGGKASKYAKAKARFIQAQILDNEFKRQSLKTSIDRITQVLNLKTSRLEKAQKAYESTIRYGDPKMSVQAIYGLSMMYKRFFNDLKAMPIPKGLEQKDAESFKAEIEKIAYPMEEKSIESLSEAFAVAKKFELHDGSVPMIKKQLDIANMQEQLPLLVQVRAPRPLFAVEQGGL